MASTLTRPRGSSSAPTSSTQDGTKRTTTLWSAAQRKLVDLGERDTRFLMISGPVRSGKSRSAIAGFLSWASENFEGHTFLLTAKHSTQMRENIIPLVEDICAESGEYCEYQYSKKRIIVGANRFLLMEAGSISSSTKIEGLTLSGAYLDEVVSLPIEFVDEVLTRCSEPGAKIIMSCNPVSPYNPIKTRFFDRAEDIKGEVHEFELKDNPYIAVDGGEYVKTLASTLTGVFLRRRVYGEWAHVGGLIYENYTLEDPPARKPHHYELSVDYATASVTHALLIACYDNYVDYVIDEWRWDAIQTGQQLTDADQIDGILNMVGRERVPSHVVCDPSAPNMIVALQAVFRAPVIGADNDKDDGIPYTRAMLEYGRVRIAPRCTELLRELSLYEWDERLAAKGIDQPKKENDHGADALRYYAFTRLRSPRGQSMKVVKRWQ